MPDQLLEYLASIEPAANHQSLLGDILKVYEAYGTTRIPSIHAIDGFSQLLESFLLIQHMSSQP